MVVLGSTKVVHDNPRSAAGVVALVEGKEGLPRNKRKGTKNVEYRMGVGWLQCWIRLGGRRGAGAKKHEARMMHYGDRRY